MHFDHPLQQYLRRTLGIPIPHPQPIPANTLRAAVWAYARFEGMEHHRDTTLRYQTEMCWAYILQQLGSPLAWSWCEHAVDGVPPQTIPLSIRYQLLGQRVASGVTVQYENRPWLLIDTFCELGPLGEIITELPDPKTIWLADPATIDLTR